MTHSFRRAQECISVLIVTADNMTSELLRNAFGHSRTGFAVETMTGSSQNIIGGLADHKPDVVLVSEELQDGPQAGVKVLQRLSTSSHIPVIMLLQSPKPECVVNAFRGGARGIFYRTHSLKALSKCIRVVHRGQIWASTADLEHLINALTQTKSIQISNSEGAPLLTKREEEVVRLVADGMKNREIAQTLQIKEHSIRNYVYRIFEKLGVSSRVELTLYAFSRRDQTSS